MLRLSHIALFILFATVLLSPPIIGQCNDNQHTGSGAVGLGPNGEVYDRFSSAYQFEMFYQTSSTVYLLTEPMIGTTKLQWSGWCLEEILRLDPATLSDTSHTKPFTLHSGDVVTVYRELSWLDQSGAFFPSSYMARDTLDYAVEIRDAETGGRVARLDSVGLLRRDVPGPPTYYGTSANAARLSWTVPAELDGREVTLGVRLYARGDGAYDPGRYDRMTVNLSDRLTDPGSQQGIIQPIPVE